MQQAGGSWWKVCTARWSHQLGQKWALYDPIEGASPFCSMQCAPQSPVNIYRSTSELLTRYIASLLPFCCATQHRWDITVLSFLPLYQNLSNFQVLAGINYFLNEAGASRAWCQHCRNWQFLVCNLHQERPFTAILISRSRGTYLIGGWTFRTERIIQCTGPEIITC